ncbi:Undecaprenyl-phosphate galactose phosphotransferase, WbaP/exopolysaccharide biosynthesis polyprenyl glycosylphosphotransferase [Gulbenkiania indica]|uniref:Undecaprenyl-phosphate galactose phosphotransferase, WbaP/exopolysaccharide biosynthesis polyprenyl glycosylphosphotransferase n=1 Tax=Gulbenkiania indica TaxID=375574 RepID=A0A0K6GX66_9NEIS|nr:undecaprenyl-phosphate galactose phosphotransferase WbaP [Gulbenkiania indica]CUA83336.1 Undecaprenyl-phosphate galactose phosphotransferase, WbaP/exopolysaccharide biosynthesis polyprenyl glycosylphosphotransferase [Gulbenkiania indica]
MSKPEDTSHLTETEQTVTYLASGCCPPPYSRILSSLFLMASDLVAWSIAFLVGLMALFFQLHGTSLDFMTWWQAIGLKQLLGFSCFALIGSALFWHHDHYRERQPFWSETAEVMRTVAVLALLYGAFMLALNLPLSRAVWLASFTVALGLIPLLRMATRAWLTTQGYWTLPVLIVGAGPTAAACYHALMSDRQLGYRVRAFIVSDADTHSLSPVGGIPLIRWPQHDIATLGRLVRGYQVIHALEPAEHARHAGWLETLSQQFMDLHVAPPLADLPLACVRPHHFLSHDVLLLRARNSLLDQQAQRLKRTLDVVLSGALILVLLPVLALIALLIRLEGGPALFGQPRIGQDGLLFMCLKFRTMRVDAEAALERLLQEDTDARAEWAAFRKLRNDPRVTRLGVFLRKTSLDELPQLFNVLLGEMSLVGPRPRLPDETDSMYYRAVRPGITGLWQVSGRNLLAYEERLALDAWYVRNWNVWADIAILFKTVRTVLLREGAY